MNRLKTIIFSFACALAVLCALGATSIDKRYNSKFPDARYNVTQHVIPSADANAVAQTINIPGSIYLSRIDVVTSNSTNAITYTVALTDAASITLFSKASITENSPHSYSPTASTPDFNSVPIMGTHTLTVTPSGDPGASGGTVDVTLWGP